MHWIWKSKFLKAFDSLFIIFFNQNLTPPGISPAIGNEGNIGLAYLQFQYFY